MTLYVAAYDVESAECLAACKTIAAVHHRLGMPATFFITGKVLEAQAEEYGRLLRDPLFEAASHTYSHGTLRDHPFCGPAVSASRARQEVFLGKEWVEHVFEQPCLGMRPGCGFEDGMKGAPDVLGPIAEAGYRYVSSMAWGLDYSLPAPLSQPFSYAADGFPHLWELPAHGWHENLLKDHNGWGPRRLTLWPPQMPEAVPPGFITAPEEEFRVNRVFIERATAEDLAFVSLIWHPWSLARCDPRMRMLDLTFALVRDLGLPTGTYADLLARVQAERYDSPAAE